MPKETLTTQNTFIILNLEIALVMPTEVYVYPQNNNLLGGVQLEYQ